MVMVVSASHLLDRSEHGLEEMKAPGSPGADAGVCTCSGASTLFPCSSIFRAASS